MGLASLLRHAAGRGDAPAADTGVPLETVRRRLELFLAALYGRGIPVAAAEVPPTPPLLRRLLRRAPAPPRTPAASTDGARVLLPPVLDEAGASDALARYQLLAVEQAERLVRGTSLLAPGDDAPLERDLYLLAESAAVDASIARAAPGLVPALRRARAEALAHRPSPDALPASEREVEALVRRVLESDPASPPEDIPAAASASESLAWARATAARAKSGVRGYRGVRPVAAWGSVPPLSAPGTPLKPIMLDAPMGRGEDDSGVVAPDAGPDSGEMDDRPSALPDASAGGGGEGEDAPAPGAGEEEDAPEVEGSDRVGDSEPAEEAAPPDPFGAPPKRQRPNGRETFEYPEWDWKASRYVERASTVRVVEPQAADGAWAAEVLRAHAPMVRRLREKFERLRARRVRLTRQSEGDELDLAACVGALVDRRTGRAPDDRLYLQVRPARRGLAIALLVDISGSTDERVGRSRIIDLEKVALLLTCEALDALGDEYTVLTFSGKGAGDVRLRTLKGFGERTGEAVRGRVTALRPEGYTRLGPAVRHAAALLARPGAGHRLLLILSDGRPNDVDQYAGRYGVEDARQAVAEARRQGIFPFCITIDQKGPAYISRIFGQSGHVILRHADQLPLALSQAVRHLLGA